MNVHPNKKRFEIEEDEEIILPGDKKGNDFTVLENGKVVDDFVSAIVLAKKRK